MPLILGTNSIKDTGYDVANSCRFNDASDDNLTRTFSAQTTRTKHSISFWCKRATFGHTQFLFEGIGDTYPTQIYFSSGDALALYDAGENASYVTTALFRDPSAWMHILCRIDTTQASNDNRVRFYVNGVLFATSKTNSISQSTAVSIGKGGPHVIGKRGGSSDSFDGYLCEFIYVYNVSHEPTDFGEFDSDSGIWKPLDGLADSLTFGNNGFYLDFQDSSALGNDVSGNNTDFTANNLTAVDQSSHTCTNNFATLNPLIYGANYSFSEGNLQFAQTATNWDTAYSSIGVTKGKWYMEFKGKVGAYYDVGVTDVIDPTNNLTVNSGCVAFKSNGEFARGGAVGDGLPSTITSPASNTYTADDIIGIALDVDNEAVYFSKNGAWEVSSDPESGASKTGAVTLPNSGSTYFFAFAAYKGSAASGTGQVNFGGGSVDAISSGNADADGHGNFEHAPPSGYFALCTKNLAEYG